MVVIDITLWKGGDPARKVELGSATISNVGGTPTRGEYIAHFYGKKGKHLGTCSVKDFPRKRLLGWDLLFRAMRACFDNRNPKNERPIDALSQTLAELRHSYAQLARGEVGHPEGNGILQQRAFADGLIAPAIRRLEQLQRDGFK